MAIPVSFSRSKNFPFRRGNITRNVLELCETSRSRTASLNPECNRQLESNENEWPSTFGSPTRIASNDVCPPRWSPHPTGDKTRRKKKTRMETINRGERRTEKRKQEKESQTREREKERERVTRWICLLPAGIKITVRSVGDARFRDEEQRGNVNGTCISRRATRPLPLSSSFQSWHSGASPSLCPRERCNQLWRLYNSLLVVRVVCHFIRLLPFSSLRHRFFLPLSFFSPAPPPSFLFPYY